MYSGDNINSGKRADSIRDLVNNEYGRIKGEELKGKFDLGSPSGLANYLNEVIKGISKDLPQAAVVKFNKNQRAIKRLAKKLKK